jgi:serine/threonine protein kinase
MARNLENDDQTKIPTKPLMMPGAGDPSQEYPITDSLLGAMFGAGRSKPSRGTWQPPSPEQLQGDFPQYEIRGILGRGGMGAVYKGWQRSLDRFVAIKILPPDFDDGVSGFTERFKREAKAMAHLKHPGIVAVHDAGTTSGGLLYFVMECIEGTDVQKLVTERGRIEPGEALRITGAVCAALAYAHGHGVIHRDIKPSNVMIEADGDVKIADFGLAKSTAPETTLLTMSNITMGTLDYMPPEALQDAAHADHRADIFAVGVMLYQMLTGKLPRGKYIAPSRLVPGLDKRMDRIVDRALQPERTARYASAGEMGAALAPISRSIARRAPAVRGAKASRKMPVLLAISGIAALAALAHFKPWKNGAPRPAPPKSPDVIRGASHAKAPVTPATATKDAPFVNTLGQEFVPVPGTQALFCRWETRVKDYAEYARVSTADTEWMVQEKDGVPVGREPEHPVCALSWDEANAFCKWLTQKENDGEKLPKGMQYRLPTDEEWDRAAGLATVPGATPSEKSGKNDMNFPWGTDFPPPGKVGNYADETFHGKFAQEPDKWIEGYTDGFATTAPVGSFPPNEYGICDLGGNVWEWCGDWFDASRATRVLRGGSWDHFDRGQLLSSHRSKRKPGNRDNNHGFRAVLAPAP